MTLVTHYTHVLFSLLLCTLTYLGCSYAMEGHGLHPIVVGIAIVATIGAQSAFTVWSSGVWRSPRNLS